MRPKILLICIVSSIFLFLGINLLTGYSEDFWYALELAKRPELITASINKEVMERGLKELKIDKQKRIDLKNAGINARAAISVRINRVSGEKELFSLNSNDRLAIASITKLMTALVALKTYDSNQLILITDEAVSQEGESKYGNLVVGEELSLESLLHTMLIESSNDAAYALTQPIGHDAFVELMNLYTKNIGLKDTYFVNTSGLEPDNPEKVKNYSTVRDLVKLAEYIIENNPEVFNITTNKSYRVLRPNGTLHHFITGNTNRLLGEIPEIIGGKTGWSPAAGGCLIIVLKDDKGYYINVILGARDRFAEMRKILGIIRN